MLPTLAERLREQQARTRSRPPARQPWPLPVEPPTALLFQPPPQPQAADPVVVAPHEPAAPMAPQTRTAQAEVLLLVVWAVLVMIDGALALAALIDHLGSRGREGSGEQHRKRVALAAPSSAAVSDSARGPGCQRVAAEMPLVATPM